MQEPPIGRVLIVAGSDSGGGAGIQADVKTVTMLGCYAMTAITALTAQNTQGVFGIVPVDPSFVAQQMEVVLADIGADAIKTGMLHNADVIRAVAIVCEKRAHGIQLVVDPVMLSKGGHPLLDRNAMGALTDRLIPRATLVTPNVPEAELLTGHRIQSPADMGKAADTLLGLGAQAVLVKGGHLSGDVVVDLLRTADGEEQIWEAPRVETRHTHGTGCTLSSAIAAGIAEGLTLKDAVTRAQRFVQRAIETAPGLGKGHGPLNHMHLLSPTFH